jgi:hypothetical protein
MAPRRPEPRLDFVSFEEWLGAQQFPSPGTPAEAELHRKFVLGLRLAWEAGFVGGLMAKERHDRSPFPHTPKENDDA